jgi:hypothetical protein
LLKRLDQSVQKKPIKTTVAKFDAILMMFAEGVHRLLLCGEIPGTYRGESLCDIEDYRGISRAKPLASITLLSVFLPIDTFFRKMIVRGVERPIVAAKH